VVGLFLRIYHYQEWFMYSHDQDLLGWFIKDILVNHHIRLIGQETSQHGVFIGPLFYYLNIPFYLLANWSPLGGNFLVALLGGFGVWSFWYVFERIIGKFAAFSGAVFYAVSYSLVLSDREVVPTMPVVIWSVWFLYAVYLLLNGKQKLGWLLSGLLLGLVWHLNMGLLLISPLVIFAFVLSRKKISVKPLMAGLFIAFIFALPFILFEVRHGFQQTNAILFSGLHSEVVTGIEKFDRVIQLVSKNVYRIFLAEVIPLTHIHSLLITLGIMLFVSFKKIIRFKLSLLMWLWVVIYMFFFTYNPIVISEYYLNGLNVIWILFISAFLSFLYHTRWPATALVLLSIFVVINLYRFSGHVVDRSGYIDRKGIIQLIKADAEANNYPCVSLSYITSPGYELGYRYITWRENLKTKAVSDGAPVYTIVFPHSLVDKIDRSVGALGLIYPEYDKYTDISLETICSGEDLNTAYPLFGYTE